MKGTELNFLRVSDIWHRIYFANICKEIFVILEVQFHHEGGLSKGCYFELFYSSGSLCPPCKISFFTEAPFYLFGTFSEILTNFVVSIIFDFFLFKIWVIPVPILPFSWLAGLKWGRNGCLFSNTILLCPKTLPYPIVQWQKDSRTDIST